MTKTYKCPKCNGTGFLSHYLAIANGVCFSCAGNGVKKGVAPVPGILFPMSAILKETGERIHFSNIKAKNETEAVQKAVAQLSRGNGYIPESAAIVA